MTITPSEPPRHRPRRPAPSAEKDRLRLWLRLLRVTRAIESELRERLRTTFEITLPQFDVLAALVRRDEGITMTELSRYLMVSNGNVTGIVDRLVEDGWVERSPTPGDRRATLVRLTARGRSDFTAMAIVHEGWVAELLSGFGKAETAGLIAQLDGLVGRLVPRTRTKDAPRKEGKRR